MNAASPRPRAGIGRISPHMLAGPGEGLSPVAINLASNENAWGPGQMAQSAARAAVTTAARYDEEAAPRLCRAVATRFGVDAAGVAVGHGSDDLLARLARAYLEPGSELVRSANGYLKVPNYAHANDAVAIAAPDVNFRASVDNLLAAVTERTRAVYLANPDNPSGSWLSGEEIRRLHAGLPSDVLLVLDCAYAEYVDAPGYEGAERLVEEARNVVMTRTFSKIFGLAGMRLGWLYAPPEIAGVITRIGLTFPVSSCAVAAACAALQDRAHTAMVFSENAAARRTLEERLSALGLTVYPSQGNFLLIGFPDPGRPASAAAAMLRSHGVAVRRFASPAYDACLRITLGQRHELATAALLIDDFLKGHP